MNTVPTFTEYANMGDMAEPVASLITKALHAATGTRGTASLMLSGGGTPRQVYAELAGARLAWDHVSVGLVDERWVAPDDARSNERLVRETLLRAKAKGACFATMITSHADPFLARDEVDARYAALPIPYDVICLGMGLDGHTASWFPRARGLERALDPSSFHCVAAIDASGAEIAGDTPLRMTLTLGAIANARLAILLISGVEKRAVYERAVREGAISELPISAAIEALGDRLHVFWVP